jgi:NAD(P)-dependent dehydrogenase (short-subunit alcohol dehydrogenase family)
MGRVDGRTALITGGARGIGEAIARRLTEEGARVILTDLLTKEGEALAAELNKKHGQGTAKFFPQDVTKEKEWQNLAQKLSNENVDVLVNNAGIFLMAPMVLTELSEWQKVFAVNVEGVFLACKYMVPLLQEQASKWKGGASIINLSSMAGLVGAPGASAYCASKGAVKLFTKALAMECAENPPVRVNSIHPGIINTKMSDAVLDGSVAIGAAENLEAGREAMAAAHPLGRMGLAEEIANAVLYLASEESSFTTGAEHVIDGGVTAR